MRKYIKGSSAVTDYREIPNPTHHTVSQKGWEEVADFAIQWANMHAVGQVTLDDVRSAAETRDIQRVAWAVGEGSIAISFVRQAMQE